MKKILIADDEPNIVEIIAFNLKALGYEIICAYDGSEALELFQLHNPDLILLDIMMPKLDGFEVCKAIRKQSHVPIIMLTARAEELDKVLGLELGADDYVTKPFGVNELIARVKTNLRRNDSQTSNVISYGKVKLDVERHEFVRDDNKIIELTRKELKLMQFFASHPGQIFTRDDLMENVWAYEYYGDARIVDVTIRRLRLKIEESPDNPRYILTKRGIGYFFNDAL